MGEPHVISALTRKRAVIAGELAKAEKRCEAMRNYLLAAIGIHEDERNLRNKISRGGFTAAFLLQCLEAIGAKNVWLSTDS